MRARAAAALLVLVITGGGAPAVLAAGTQVVLSHLGDTSPAFQGFVLGVDGDPLAALNGIVAAGIADDQGFPVWAMDDRTDLAGVRYRASLTQQQSANALAAGFTLRVRLRALPGPVQVPATSYSGIGRAGWLFFGANAAAPAGDGSLRVALGASEVVVPGGPVHHLIELVYDPASHSADLFADGLEVISDLPFGPSVGMLEFGTELAGEGELRVNLFELEIQIADCDDGLDNDGDGVVDLADAGCDDAVDLDEADTYACKNGADDDGDSLVDLDDPGCAAPTDEIEFDLVDGGTPWTAELSLRIEPNVFLGVAPLELSQTALVRIGDDPGGIPHVQFPSLSGSASVSATTPGAFLDGVKLAASLAPGALAVSTAIAGNTHPMRGEVRYCYVLDPTCNSFFLAMPLSTSRFDVAGIGGGTSHGTSIVLDVGFAPWTLGTASAWTQPDVTASSVVVTRKGFAHGPLSATSTFSQPSGVMQWVTPVQVDLIGANPTRNAIFASFRVRLVPEPGRFALLAAGALLMLRLAARRRRA